MIIMTFNNFRICLNSLWVDEHIKGILKILTSNYSTKKKSPGVCDTQKHNNFRYTKSEMDIPNDIS